VNKVSKVAFEHLKLYQEFIVFH